MDTLNLTSALAALGAGLVSFFSPCTLPVLPVYMGILASNADNAGRRSRFVHALAFVVGLALVLFVLGFGAGALGSLINGSTFKIVAGLVIVLLGLYSTGFVSIPALERTHRLDSSHMGAHGIVASLFMGAAFSVSWTPCVGPVLAAVLALASQEGGALSGAVLLLLYALGLGLPFLFIALGSDELLKRIKGLGPHLSKIKALGGIAIMAVGLWMILSQAQALPQEALSAQEVSAKSTSSSKAPDTGVNFTLENLEGETVSLADFRGKPVVVKFWASWCGPCRYSLPDYQELYEHYVESQDAVLLSVVAPELGDISADEFRELVADEGFSFPVLLDTTGAVMNQFGVRAFPTLAFIAADGTIAEVVTGDPGPSAIQTKLNALSAIASSEQAKDS